MEPSKLQPWETLSKEVVLDHSKFLSIEHHKIKLPNGKEITDWAWIIQPDYSLILAETPEKKYLIFEQVKYAVEGTSLAPPGGMIEESELPLNAAKRELKEETGYESDKWEGLGQAVVDGNRGVCTAHFFLARNVTRSTKPDESDLEDQHLLHLSNSELVDALNRGKFKVLGWAHLIALGLRRIQQL